MIIIMTTEDYVSFEIENNVQGRRIVDEYWTDGEWHYEYKTYKL